MGFFPDVSKGQKFTPSAMLSNNVRHIVNSLNGFQSRGILGAGSGVVRIQVYNAGSGEIAAGTAVNFSENGSLCGDVIPCEPLKDAAKPWGVTVLKLAAKEMGDCVLSGPANVALSGSGDYAQPSVGSPATFTRGATGAPVIFFSGGKGVILLGAISQDIYDGPFALSYDTETKQLKVSAGYLNRNGEWMGVSATEISPSAGTVCVCTTLGSDGEWTTPEVKISTPGQYAYPIGSVKVSGESVTVCSYRVPVAIFMVSDLCSTTN
jgi:hypothetical protein